MLHLESTIVRHYSINCRITLPAANTQLAITNVYAPSDHRDSDFFLEILAEIQSHISEPWMIIGDFNLIRSADEKSSRLVDQRLCNLFNSAMDKLALMELPLLDSLFTWSNKRLCPTLARLDRAFVDANFSSTYPSSALTSVLLNQKFLPDVLLAWHVTAAPRDAAGRLASCLKSTRAAAKFWSRCNRAPPAIIHNCKFLLLLFDYLEEYRNLSSAEMQARGLCQDTLSQMLREKAAYWKQRGKQRAIKEGDANTAFHHAHATQRYRKNTIRCIEVEGVRLTSHEAKIAALIGFFSNLLKCKRVTDELTRPFAEKEVADAVRAMNRNSAPGLDDFGPSFYSVAWSTIKTEVMQLFAAFQRVDAELERINRAYMVLLPKKTSCVIPKLIDLDQTGFIKGRSITVNFVYAMELVQCCHKRKVPTLVVKLDFAKAFDPVNWDALQTILIARGFNAQWCSWMMQLLQTSKNAVLVNGCLGPWFTYKRVLRQGDLLSPFLFLLVTDVLQSLIKHSKMDSHPILMGEPSPVLQYADVTLILFRADLTDVQNLNALLDSFSEATGLRINYTKSTAVPMYVSGAALGTMIQILGCKHEGFPQTYLGLPLSSTKLRLTAFSPVIAKSDRYLARWQANLLNPMGVVSQLDQRRRSFLWTGEDTLAKGNCLAAWENVCNSKEDGGLGIKDLTIKNTCLLVKLIHRLHTASDSSWAAWVRMHVNLETMEGEVAGCHWDTLRALLPIYQAITTCEVGDGQDDLASTLTVLYSHYIKRRVCVREVKDNGMFLVPRLTDQATQELAAAQDIIANTVLTEERDKLLCSLSNGADKIHTKLKYRLLQGPPGNADAASFV
ncbi:hypothetical protein BS78_K076500 [Paspalum vaginatum]|uniref:Reverse transcriptase domain-containing protein n=1 Tax=Paspalum vaginatum TaxID=158149 RepID=A0A9W7XA15_9POAL|nr:hypothetical protein BS78_K076500 [Paspalum vaginatum]